MRVTFAFLALAAATLSVADQSPLTEQVRTTVSIQHNDALLSSGELTINVVRTDDILPDFTPQHERSLMLERLTHSQHRQPCPEELEGIGSREEENNDKLHFNPHCHKPKHLSPPPPPAFVRWVADLLGFRPPPPPPPPHFGDFHHGPPPEGRHIREGPALERSHRHCHDFDADSHRPGHRGLISRPRHFAASLAFLTVLAVASLAMEAWLIALLIRKIKARRAEGAIRLPEDVKEESCVNEKVVLPTQSSEEIDKSTEVVVVVDKA